MIIPRLPHKESIMVGRRAEGFTLVEIAIVLVIIGLLLGGVLKGQELIASARVRNLIALQDGSKAAFYGFQDRYRALPGDYSSASTNINCPVNPCLNGNGNGRVEISANPVNGSVVPEYLLAWTHLAAAGFINGSFQMQAADTSATAANSPSSPYGVYLELAYDGWYGVNQSGFTMTGSGPNPARHTFKTGNGVPVEIAAEVDRKIDDGRPYSGSFQFSIYAPGSNTPPTALGGSAACVLLRILGGVVTYTWNLPGKSANCGAASFL
jgi:prepilin-type N-terminal cleavage/methylation domain-containing protein